MSIAPRSVLRRILSEVAARPVPSALHPVLDVEDASAHLWQVESSDIGVQGFATALHFWAYGLRAFLDARSESPHFLAIAGQALCEVVEEAAARDALAAVALGRAAWPEAFVETYRMVAQPVFRSYVGESTTRYCAFYWAAKQWDESEFLVGCDTG